MLINFSCPECKAELEVASTAGGSQVACPQCNKTLTVPRKGPGPGATIGQFQIIKLLGKGGMGEVYLARQLSLGRDIALKILPARLRCQKARVQRFFKEVQLLARLDHPNIVMAHEAGEDDDILYLAMSYVPGNSLEKRLRSDGAMAESDALKLIDKLAGALDYAWREHHLLHRDIKPANILLTSGGAAKLTDFGLAKCLDDAAELTMSGDIIGSPNYMSPEQINNCTDLDCRSDMYALGATLYHLLTGKLPFAGSSLMETLKKQISENLPDPRIEHPGISEECITLLEIMLAKNRDDRHADYQSLRADIARVIAGEGPTKNALQPGESVLQRLTVELIPRPVKRLAAGSKPSKAKTRGLGVLGVKWAIAAMLGAIAALGLAVILARGWSRMHQPVPARTALQDTAPVPASPAVPPAAAPAPAPATSEASAPAPAADQTQPDLDRKCRDALQYAREHPDDFTGALELLSSLSQESEGTEWEGKISDAIGRLERSRKRAVDQAAAALRADVRALLEQNNFTGALNRIELDPGPMAEETAELRAELVRMVSTRQQALADEAQTIQSVAAKAKLDALAQGLAGDLLKGDTSTLAQRLQGASSDADLSIFSNEVNELGDQARQAADWPEQVAKSFEKNRGSSVKVEFKGGRTETLMVTGVAREKITAQRQVSAGYVGKEFSINELSAGEKLKRLGNDPRPAVKLMRGLALVSCANDWAAANKEFAEGGALGEALIRQAPSSVLAPDAATAKPAPEPAVSDGAAGAEIEPAPAVESKQSAAAKSPATKPMGTRERQAKRALLNLLKLADVSEDPGDVQSVADAILRKDFEPSTVKKINEALRDFFQNHAKTDIARQNAPIIRAFVRVTHPFLPADRPLQPKWRRQW